jgi:catechol 2,3-dioxygenase-like lactoylglutathione lyase family enzyme
MEDAYLGLDHVQVAIPVGEEPRARAFYGALLGLAELPKPADMAARGGCWFACGAHQIHVGVEKDFRPAKKAHPAIRLRDEAAFRALEERLAGAGVAVRGAADGPAGVVRAFVDDPFGNRLELVAPIRSPG